ncbi:MAG: hypothetical protein WC655_20545 [Candidatus Hydrogenedentales bacterium]|jgi:hypothetical protein
MTKYYNAALDRISFKALSVLCAGVLVLVTMALVFSVSSSATNMKSQVYGGQEVIDAHITTDGLMRAYSRISITKCPDCVASLPIRISQPGATLESVTFDGRKAPFAADTGRPGEGNYTVMPGLPEPALKSAKVEVVWSIPLDKLDSDGPNSYRFHLRGTIPISSYTANVFLDEGVPYTFGGKFADTPNFSMFWTKRSGGRYSDDEMGCCGIGLVEKGNGA